MIALSGCLSGRVSRAISRSRDGGRRGGTRPAGADLRPRQHVRRAAERRARRAAAAFNRGLPKLAERRGLQLVATGDVHYLEATDAHSPRRASLHPVRRLAQEPEPLAFGAEGVLLQDPGRDGARLPRTRGRHAPQPRGRRALQRRARARPDPAAELPRAGRPRRVRLPRRAVREGPRQALRRARPRSSTSGCASSSRLSAKWASRTTS